MEIAIEPKGRILVVDDEPAIVAVISELLASMGLWAVKAGTVAEAAAAARDEVALAIIDKNLPDGSGLDVLRDVRQRWPMAETLIMTGYPSVDSAIEALRLGAADYLLKPVRHIDELRHKISRALERRQMRCERDETLRELKEAQRLRAHANHAQMMAQLGRLMAAIVHEINNPLTVIRSTLGLLDLSLRRGVASGEEFASHVQSAISAANQVIALVTDVRRVSSVDAFQPGQRQVVSVEEIVDSALVLAGGAMKGRATAKVSVSGDAIIEASSVRFTQVLLNLIVNAAEAMTKPGEVRISARRVGSRVQIEVEDDGAGMSPEVQARLFEPFFTTKKPGEGSGLGLALSREIVTEHGGTIRLRSPSEHGTCFTIDLPAADKRSQ